MAYQIANLPTEIRRQVADYIEFLLKNYPKKDQRQSTKKPRLSAYGRYKGQIRMSKDFDAPLEDFKEYR